MSPITVVTIDDHPLIREGIRSLIQKSQDIELVGEGWVGEHLLPLLRQHQPDVLLLDLSMPQRESDHGRSPENSFQAVPAIYEVCRHFPQVKIIVITQYGSPTLVQNVFEAGARGYLLKDDALTQELQQAIQTVYVGGLYLSPAAQQHLLQQSPVHHTLLTPRQLEILQQLLVHPDWSYAQHAAVLHISENTISNHVRQIFERLGVNSLAAALVRGLELGILSLKDGEPTADINSL